MHKGERAQVKEYIYICVKKKVIRQATTTTLEPASCVFFLLNIVTLHIERRTVPMTHGSLKTTSPGIFGLVAKGIH